MRIPLALILASAAAAADDPAKMWAEQVKPILERSCFDCHGPKKSKHNLRLDSLEAIKKGGEEMGPAVIAGKPAESPLIKVLTVARGDETAMPPEGKGKQLTAAEIATIKAWISASTP